MRAVELATTATLTALAFVTPHHLSRGQLAAYSAAKCALAGVIVADAVHQDLIEEPTEEGLVEVLPASVVQAVRERPAATLLAFAGAGAALQAVSMPLELKVDRVAHEWLQRQGVGQPRALFAAVTAATSVLAFFAPRSA
ncbi:hypothetical protein BJY21_002698 [Kineosphaera limosa]|uniref:Uncharacterized protein n=1 Tax=Kineosphaera limosa NBRC 100340 TaxID=1184609 RepID=K6WS46_9MICO|nr:hypothetical protein [Kineosphaera limosa]NYE01514.1 hypothetical protein [Kineosphaera limosa]GAB96671.1 hypothetical protein KILIM_045_00020 [Kineosphaera limosa NBRC 100340]